MTGLTSVRLQPLTSPAATARPARRFPSSSSPCAALSLPLFSKRPSGRVRARAVAVAPVARYGRGGGYRPGLGRGRRPTGSRSGSSDSDDEALDFSRITSNSVRLIDEQQNMIGVVSVGEAIQKAEDAELDLVILSADADPPVLRIVDYNKYRYNIDSHDYSVRLKAAQRFLKDGDKVKVIVNLKRRENDFRDMAIELLKRFQVDVGELATEESKNFSDKNMFIVLLPNKVILKKGQEPPKKKEAPATEVSVNV